MDPAGRIRYLENVKFYVSYFLQYTKIIQMTTMQTYFIKILIKLKIEVYTKPKNVSSLHLSWKSTYDVMLFMCQSH
jgi:hypothetical protein